MFRNLRFLRHYKVLALESSCDDSCVALIDRKGSSFTVIDHLKKTLNSAAVGGIIPMAAHDHHHSQLAPLVESFCKKHGINAKNPPDLLCCTRGPGMAGSLSSSLQLSKGLSIAWGVPLVGVHHMLGHILVANLPKKEQPEVTPPKYPFLSLLCSGGHTMLVLSKSLADHEIVIDTNDIACGDSLDKCARELGLTGNMLGKELERFVMENPGVSDKPGKEFKISLPFKGPHDKKYPDQLYFSFASFLSRLQWYKSQFGMDETQRIDMAHTVQERIFDHMVDRINTALRMHGTSKAYYDADSKFAGVSDIVVSGGVAANRRLRDKLRTIDFKECIGTDPIFHFPDLDLCTDNAVMIGVAGIEIFERLGVKSDLGIRSIRKWPLGELLKVGGWLPVTEEEKNIIEIE